MFCWFLSKSGGDSSPVHVLVDEGSRSYNPSFVYKNTTFACFWAGKVIYLQVFTLFVDEKLMMLPLTSYLKEEILTLLAFVQER